MILNPLDRQHESAPRVCVRGRHGLGGVESIDTKYRWQGAYTDSIIHNYRCSLGPYEMVIGCRPRIFGREGRNV